MKNFSEKLYVGAAKLDGSAARIIVFALSLALFVLAAGAPEAAGTIGF